MTEKYFNLQKKVYSNNAAPQNTTQIVRLTLCISVPAIFSMVLYAMSSAYAGFGVPQKYFYFPNGTLWRSELSKAFYDGHHSKPFEPLSTQWASLSSGLLLFSPSGVHYRKVSLYR